MLTETGRLLWTWCRITLALAAICGLVLALYGWGSTAFTLTVIGAVVLELLAIRGLAREWSWQASGCWWWPR
ncbi:MAG: hypothetical protein ACRDTF_02340 [Pseudonocardiaceae bacterium]